MDTALPSQIFHKLAVHDAEIQSELITHLFVPLDLQRGWTNYQNLSRPMPNDEFERYHSRSFHIENIKISFVRQEGLEPPTSGSGGQNYTGA